MKISDKRDLSDGLEIVIARSPDEIEAIRSIWEEIQHSEPYPVVNADIDRYLSVLKASGDDVKPYVMVLEQNGQPAAMIIGRIKKHRLKLKLGYKTLFKPSLSCLTVTYGGILGQPGEEVCSLLISKLMKVLHQREVDMVYFNHLKTDSHIYHIARSMPSFLCRGHFSKIEPHWIMSVPKDINQFYKACSKKHRGNLKRAIRKLEKEYPNQVRIITYTGEEDLDDAIKAASRISQSTYQHGLSCGFTDNPRIRVLLATAARRSWLRMAVLYIDEEPGAFQIGLHYHVKYVLEQIGFDPKWGRLELGTVLFLRVLERICADPDIESIDFGFGDADYKRSYSDKQWQEASVFIFAPRVYPIFINMVRTSTMGLNASLEYIVNKTGFSGWIKRRWRNLLQVTKDNRH